MKRIASFVVLLFISASLCSCSSSTIVDSSTEASASEEIEISSNTVVDTESSATESSLTPSPTPTPAYLEDFNLTINDWTKSYMTNIVAFEKEYGNKIVVDGESNKYWINVLNDVSYDRYIPHDIGDFSHYSYFSPYCPIQLDIDINTNGFVSGSRAYCFDSNLSLFNSGTDLSDIHSILLASLIETARTTLDNSAVKEIVSDVVTTGHYFDYETGINVVFESKDGGTDLDVYVDELGKLSWGTEVVIPDEESFCRTMEELGFDYLYTDEWRICYSKWIYEDDYSDSECTVSYWKKCFIEGETFIEKFEKSYGDYYDDDVIICNDSKDSYFAYSIRDGIEGARYFFTDGEIGIEISTEFGYETSGRPVAEALGLPSQGPGESYFDSNMTSSDVSASYSDDVIISYLYEIYFNINGYTTSNTLGNLLDRTFYSYDETKVTQIYANVYQISISGTYWILPYDQRDSISNLDRSLQSNWWASGDISFEIDIVNRTYNIISETGAYGNSISVMMYTNID